MTNITICGKDISIDPYTAVLSGRKISKDMEIGLTEITFSAQKFQPYILIRPLTRYQRTGMINSHFQWYTLDPDKQPLQRHDTFRAFLDVFDFTSGRKHMLSFPPGFYYDFYDLIDEFVFILKEYAKHYDFHQIKVSPNVRINTIPVNFGFMNYKALAGDVLALEQREYLRSNFVFIYCNIVDNRLVGDSYSQLLRVVPVTERADNVQINIFEKITYVPICVDDFQSITFTFRDEYGRLLQLDNFVLNLHMRHGSIRHFET